VSLTTLYGVTITVEAALSAATGSYGAWGTAVFGTSTWGPDEIWTDISSYVRTIATTRRLSRDAQSWEAGTATLILDNRDASFTAANLAGPYVTGGVTGIRPWRPIRIRATWAGVTYYLYRGYSTAWNEGYVSPFPNGGDAFVTVPCQDEWAALSRFDGLAQTPVGAGEMTGTRVHRILDNAGHDGTRMVDGGVNTLQATDMSNNATVDMKLTTDSEGGGIYIASDGTVVFERQTALIENTRSSAIQATFGDSTAELGYSAVNPSYDGDLIVNIAAWSAVGGTTQIFTDETSRALYQDKRNTRSDLMCANDGQVQALAAFYVQKFSQPEDRIDSIVIRPRSNPALLFPAVLGREVRDLVRAVRRPPGAITVTRDCHVSGISHVITGDDWVTTFELWSAAVYQSVGRWGSAVWGTATWFL